MPALFIFPSQDLSSTPHNLPIPQLRSSPLSTYTTHTSSALARRSNFASRNPGVILVFCILGSIAILVGSILLHKRQKRRRREREEREDREADLRSVKMGGRV